MSTNLVPSNDEKAHKIGSFLVKAGLSLFPGGGVISHFLDLTVPNPANVRRDRMIKELSDGLNALLKEGVLKVEDLTGNEEVSELIAQAVDTARRSSGEEKLKALRNAALNGIRGGV